MPIALRADFDAADLRTAARQTKDAAQARRLLALAAIYDGGSRTEAARIGGVTLQIVRDWVLRFNAEGPAGLIDRKAPGQPPRLSDSIARRCRRRSRRRRSLLSHGVVRWRLVDLRQWLWEEFRVIGGRQTLGRELRAMGYAKLSARPRHYAQDPEAADQFKKAFRRRSRRSERVFRRHACRALVPGRGAGRAEEQDHPPLGPSRNAALCAPRPANEVGLHLRRDLPGRRQGRRPRDALLRHAGDEPAPRRDRRGSGAGR